jgi:hypothetical protein
MWVTLTKNAARLTMRRGNARIEQIFRLGDTPPDREIKASLTPRLFYMVSILTHTGHYY